MAAIYKESNDYLLLRDLIIIKQGNNNLTDKQFIEHLSQFKNSKEKQAMVNNAVIENLFNLPDPLGNPDFRTMQPNETPDQKRARLDYQNMNGTLIRLFVSNQIKPTNLVQITTDLASLTPDTPQYFAKIDELEDQIMNQVISELSFKLSSATEYITKAALEEIKLALNIAMSSPMIKKDILAIPDLSKGRYNTQLVEILNTHLNMGLDVEKGEIVFNAAISGVPDLLANLPEEKKWTVGFATVAKEPALIEKDSVLRHTLGSVALKSILDEYAINEFGSDEDSFSLINNPDAIKHVLKKLKINPKDNIEDNQSLAFQYLNKKDNIEKVISIINKESNMDLIVDSLSDNIDIALRFEIATSQKKGAFFTNLTGHEEQVALMVISFADGIIKNNNLRGKLKESDSEKLLSSIFNKLTDKLSVTSLKNQDNIDINKVKDAINSHDKIHNLIFNSISNLETIKGYSYQKINNQINSAISLALITDDWGTTPNISDDVHFSSICNWGPISSTNFAISDKNLIISAKDAELSNKYAELSKIDAELSNKDAELIKQAVDHLVEWAVGPENFGSGDPIGKRTQELLDLAETNSYAATCAVTLFKGAGLDKDAKVYQKIVDKLGSSVINNSATGPSI